MGKRAKLIYNENIILNDMTYITSSFMLGIGLMFASKRRVERGVCLVMPTDSDVKFGAAVTMMFCFSSMDILFVNSEFKVVDKVSLRPWNPSYVPKKPCRYVIESIKGKFERIKVGDKVEIKK